MSAGTARAKVWLFILTLLAGLSLLATLLLLPEVNRARRDELTARIQLAHRTSALLLAEQAHKLVATATQLSSDAVLRTSLEEMPRGQAELEVLHKTAQAQLARHNRELKAAFLLVTDARGFVLSRVGQDEAVYRDPLDGWPLVSDAYCEVVRATRSALARLATWCGKSANSVSWPDGAAACVRMSSSCSCCQTGISWPLATSCYPGRPPTSGSHTGPAKVGSPWAADATD